MRFCSRVVTFTPNLLVRFRQLGLGLAPALGLAAVLFLGNPALVRAQNLLQNGDFESVSAGAEPKATFPDWVEVQGDSSTTVRNEAVLAETVSVLSGLTSAELVAGSSTGGALRQNLSLAPVNYQIDLLFAALTPAGTAAATDRFFSMLIKHGAATTVDQINLRMITSGQLQVFNGTAFVDVGTLTGLFTTDTGTLGAFDGETPVMNTLRIAGDYNTTDGTPAVNYAITLNGTTVTNLTSFQGTTGGAANNGLDAIAFSGALSAKNFIVDNVTAVPEPAAAVMFLGGIALIPILRRARRNL